MDRQQVNPVEAGNGAARRCPSCRSRVKVADLECPMCGQDVRQPAGSVPAPPTGGDARIAESTLDEPPARVTHGPLLAPAAPVVLAVNRPAMAAASASMLVGAQPAVVATPAPHAALGSRRRRTMLVVLAGAIAALIGGGVLASALRPQGLSRRAVSTLTVSRLTAAEPTVAANSSRPDDARAPIVAISPPMAAPVVTATYPIAAPIVGGAAAGVGPTASEPSFGIDLTSARYELSGRPTQPCAAFDADDPVRRFTFNLTIVNKTAAHIATSGWGASATTPRGRAMQLCHFDADEPAMPDLPIGKARKVTLSAFVERNESVIAVIVGDGAGNAARICVRGTQQVDCAP